MQVMKSASEAVGSFQEDTKHPVELNRTRLDGKEHHRSHHKSLLQLISPPSFLSPFQFDEFLERARSKMKKAVNICTEGDIVKSLHGRKTTKKSNPSWAFSPSGAAFTQIRSLQGFPHYLQAQVTLYNAETTGKKKKKKVPRLFRDGKYHQIALR